MAAAHIAERWAVEKKWRRSRLVRRPQPSADVSATEEAVRSRPSVASEWNGLCCACGHTRQRARTARESFRFRRAR